MIDPEMPSEIKQPFLALESGMDSADHLGHAHALCHGGGHHVRRVGRGEREKQIALTHIRLHQILDAGAVAVDDLGVDRLFELGGQHRILLDHGNIVGFLGKHQSQMPPDLACAYDNDVHESTPGG